TAQRTFLQDWQRQKIAWEESNEDTRGLRPAPKRCIVSDVTTESLGLLLDENPRGVVMIRGELSGLVASLNQYKGGKGADRQFYLSLWDGDTIAVDRKSDHAREGAPLFVIHPFGSIFGSLQPDVVVQLRGQAVRGVL